MSSTDLVKAAAARRPLAMEGRHASLDRPQPLLRGPDAPRHKPPLRTHSAAAVAAFSAASAAAGARAPATAAVGGAATPNDTQGQSIADWRQLLLSTGPERLALLARSAHRGRGRGSEGNSSSASSCASSPPPSRGGSIGSRAGSPHAGSPGDGGDAGRALGLRSIVTEGAQRSTDSMRSDSQRSSRSPRPPLPQPAAAKRARSVDVAAATANAAGPASLRTPAGALASAAQLGGKQGAAGDCLAPLPADKLPQLHATDAVVAAAMTLHATASAAVPLPPSKGKPAMVRRSRSEPFLPPSVTFLLPSGRVLAPETQRTAPTAAPAAAATDASAGAMCYSVMLSWLLAARMQ